MTTKELDQETALVAGLFVGVKNMTKRENEDGRETYDMCEALQGLLEDSRIEGWNAGQAVLNKLYEKLKQVGRSQDFLHSMEDKEYQMQLLKEYGLEK